MSGRMNKVEALRSRGEGGFTIVEYMVALTILALLSTMVTLGFSTMEDVSTSTYHRGQATNYAIVGGDEFSSVIQSAISPEVAAELAGAGSSQCGSTSCSGSSPYATSTGPCWGTGDSTLTSNVPPYAAPPHPPATFTSPAQLLVLAASNYAIEFCGYQRNAAAQAPQIILIQPDVSSCNLTSAPNVPTCPLVEYNLGSSYCTISSSTGLCPTPTSGAVNTINRVWCDSYCRGLTTTPGSTPAYFSYCMSPYPGSTGVSSSCDPMPWTDMAPPPAYTSGTPANPCSIVAPNNYVRLPTSFSLTNAYSSTNWSQCLSQITNVTIDLYVLPNTVGVNTPVPTSGPTIASEVYKQVGLPNAS